MTFFTRFFHRLYVGGYNLLKFTFDITTLLCVLGGIIVVPAYILFELGGPSYGPFYMLLGFVIIPVTWIVSLVIAIFNDFHLLLTVEIALLLGAGLSYLSNKALKRFLRDPFEKRSKPWSITEEAEQQSQA